MNQKERVLEYVQKHGFITGRIAVDELDIMDVSKRIGELEKLGYRFDHHRHDYLNRHGEPRHYTIYRLEA